MDNIFPTGSDAEKIISEYLWRLFPRHFDASSSPCDVILPPINDIRGKLIADVSFAFESDPAASSTDEIILCYPGFYAIAVYRLSHELYKSGVPILPRMISEYAHSMTGIDIHPGATIGSPFFIDHGTGVVIGETAVIGDRVILYQGVTIGAKSIDKEKGRREKRHPTIGNDCVIYAGATILGGDTVIGDGCVIGGNVWLTHSLPLKSRIIYEK